MNNQEKKPAYLFKEDIDNKEISFNKRLAYNVGNSFIGGISLGAIVEGLVAIPSSTKLNYKLRPIYLKNNVIRGGSLWGMKFGTASFIYTIVDQRLKQINKIEIIRNLNPKKRRSISLGITGFIYGLPKGLKKSIFLSYFFAGVSEIARIFDN